MFISDINMNTSTYFVITKSPIYVMKLIIIFGTKIYQKFPIFLTSTRHRQPRISLLFPHLSVEATLLIAFSSRAGGRQAHIRRLNALVILEQPLPVRPDEGVVPTLDALQAEHRDVACCCCCSNCCS